MWQAFCPVTGYFKLCSKLIHTDISFQTSHCYLQWYVLLNYFKPVHFLFDSEQMQYKFHSSGMHLDLEFFSQKIFMLRSYVGAQFFNNFVNSCWLLTQRKISTQFLTWARIFTDLYSALFKLLKLIALCLSHIQSTPYAI